MENSFKFYKVPAAFRSLLKVAVSRASRGRLYCPIRSHVFGIIYECSDGFTHAESRSTLQVFSRDAEA